MSIGNEIFYIIAVPANFLGDMEALTQPDDKRRALRFESAAKAVDYATDHKLLAGYKIVKVPA